MEANEKTTNNNAPLVVGEGPFLLVGNPTSQSGKAAYSIAAARKILEKRSVDYEFRSTLPNGETVSAVASAITDEGFRKLIYLGGDGTFNEVAKGICQSGLSREVVLGMLPSGTANDQGKSFGISSSRKHLDRNVQIILNGHLTTMDVGEVSALSESNVLLRRDLFFDSVSWGLSAAILALRNKDREAVKNLPLVRSMYRDNVVYARAVAHEISLSWMNKGRFSADVTIDGHSYSFDKLSDLIVSNTTLFAAEWVIDPQARSDDGLFEIAPFAGIRDYSSKMILHHKKSRLTEQMLNRIGISHTPFYRGRKIHIQLLSPESDKFVPAQIDGEEFPAAAQFSIDIYPQLLNLIIPPDAHWI